MRMSPAWIVAGLLVLAGAAAAQPMHYDLKARVVPSDSALSVDLVISISADRTDAPIQFVLGRGYRVDVADAGPAASVAVAPVDKPWPGLQAVTITPRRPGRPLKLRLAYVGPLGPSGRPPLNVISPQLVELNLDSMWAPIRSDMGGRFTLDAEIAGIPPDMVVVAPGEVTRRGDRVLIKRERSGFDVAFAAMPGLERAQADGFEFYADDLESGQSRLYRRHGAQALAYFERWFGTMPGRPARVVMVRRERDSGYARPGYVVVTAGERGGENGLAKFIAHEFAHAWWSSGDATTEDRWLSESVAEYVSLRYVEHAFGVADREEMLAERRAKSKDAGPVLGKGLRGNAVLYNKGPVLLFDLESRIGRERIDALLAELARRPPETTADFMKALAARAGEDAAREFEAALRA